MNSKFAVKRQGKFPLTMKCYTISVIILIMRHMIPTGDWQVKESEFKRNKTLSNRHNNFVITIEG